MYNRYLQFIFFFHFLRALTEQSFSNFHVSERKVEAYVCECEIKNKQNERNMQESKNKTKQTINN